MNKRMEEITELALKLGLDPFPVVFETIDQLTMHNICSYGLPTRARHWSYGRSYDHQKTYGEMGYSKVYEVILNNNPSYAFMMDTNSEVQNLFITAHCLGHSHFFKHNCMFQSTDRNMISHAAEHAGRIENYIDRYGFEKVERLMDIGFALDNHIDWHKGLYRKKNSNLIVKRKNKSNMSSEFDDLIYEVKKGPIEKVNRVVSKKIPPHPEKDIIWFLINYAPLEEWEQDVLDIIREEAFYFYPQRMTKIMNEGWASYWHAEIMYQYNGLTSNEYLDFVRDHEKVVQPGGNPFRINPYFLGFRIFKDIEKRWDEQYGKGAGRKKIFEVVKEEDDISFIRNYLTADLVRDLKLFTYGYLEEYEEDFEEEKFIQIKGRLLDDIIEAMVNPLYNGGAPKIVVENVGQEGCLELRHLSEEVGVINRRFAEKTIEYLWELWAAPIKLYALDDDGNEITMFFDEVGFRIIDENADEEDVVDTEKTIRKRIIIP